MPLKTFLPALFLFSASASASVVSIGSITFTGVNTGDNMLVANFRFTIAAAADVILMPNLTGSKGGAIELPVCITTGINCNAGVSATYWVTQPGKGGPFDFSGYAQDIPWSIDDGLTPWWWGSQRAWTFAPGTYNAQLSIFAYGAPAYQIPATNTLALSMSVLSGSMGPVSQIDPAPEPGTFGLLVAVVMVAAFLRIQAKIGRAH